MRDSRRSLFETEHEQFRAAVKVFLDRQVRPKAQSWRDAGQVDRSLFREAAEAGILGMSIPERFGGGGSADFRFNAVVAEEVARDPVSDGMAAIVVTNDVLVPYFVDLTTDEQRSRWLPGLASGELVAAVAMTEPGAGSDLAGIRTSAVRDGDAYIVNGAKTFITNGQNADLVITAVRTGADRHGGLSLLVIEADREGFERGRKLDKIGLPSQDTSELFFVDVRVPVANVLGVEGQGFPGLMQNLPQERLSIAVGAAAASEGVLSRTIEYVRQREAFGKSIGAQQNTRFELAHLVASVRAARAYVDDCVRNHVAGELDAAEAAAVKFWTTELHVEVTTRCLQLYGGYGYMKEYQIARDFLDARVTTIYGGTTEIMKEVVGRSLGL